MSADKLSYEKFTKELRKNYEKHTIDWRVTKSLQNVYETIRNIFVSAFYKVLQIRPMISVLPPRRACNRPMVRLDTQQNVNSATNRKLQRPKRIPSSQTK